MKSSQERKYTGTGTTVASDTPNAKSKYADLPALSYSDYDASSAAQDRFIALLEAQREPLMRYAVGLVRNPVSAEDLVQETLLRAFKARDTFEADSNMPAWLSRIQRNTFINNSKKERRDPAGNYLSVKDPAVLDFISVPESKPDQNPERLFFQSHVETRIKNAIAELPDRFRKPLVLRDFDGLPYGDISEALGVPVGTMKSRLFRARAMMRARLQ